MATFEATKVLASLPSTLTPNMLYCVRVGAGFDLYLADSTGQIAYKINGGDGSSTPGAITSVTGTTYTLVAGDSSNGIACANGGAITVTVPANATVAFAVGTRIPVRQTGAGAVTIEAASGVTLASPNGASTSGNGDGRVLEQIAADTWMLW